MCQRHLSSQRSPGRNKTENLVVIYLSKGSTSCLQAQNHWNKSTTSKRILRSKSSGSSTQLPCVKNTQGLQVETPSGFRRAQWILWFINTPGISFPSLLPWLSGVSKAGLFPWIYFSWPLSPLLSSSTFVCSTESSACCSTRSASNSEKKILLLKKNLFIEKKNLFYWKNILLLPTIPVLLPAGQEGSAEEGSSTWRRVLCVLCVPLLPSTSCTAGKALPASAAAPTTIRSNVGYYPPAN